MRFLPLLFVSCMTAPTPYVDNCHATPTFTAGTYHFDSGDTITVFFVDAGDGMTVGGGRVAGTAGMCENK